MRRNHTLALAAAAALALAAPAAVLYGHDADSRSTSARPENDVRVRLRVRGKKKSELRVRLTVKNRGRHDLEQVEVTLHDGDPADPIWSDVISLRKKKRFRLKLRVPAESTGPWLTAESRIIGAEDDAPANNEDTAPGPVDAALTAAERGRDLYLPLCAACHGTDGRGGTSDENIAREDWHEILEAFREGEDGMPVYASLTAQDAKDIAAYLLDPGAVPQVTPPVDPPPDPPAAPTYTADVKPIFDTNCVACHRAGGASAGIALDTHASASSGAAASLASIQAGRMPPGGALSSAQIQTIADWITDGKPQ